MDGKALAAPPDTGIFEALFPHMRKVGIEPNQVFISAGIFVIDCKLWRNESISVRLLKLAREKKDVIEIIVEDLFTIYFRNNFKILDPSWGFIENSDYVVNNTFWVGVYPGMTDTMIDYMAKIIKEAVSR